MLTTLGLYQYDPTLFDEMLLPEGVSREIVIDSILMDCAELETLLPDPAVLKSAIRRWSAASVGVWQHLYETTQYEYNPIWNKDGTITETETRNLAGSGDTTIDNSVAAFNSNELQPQAKAVTSAETTDTGTISRSRSEQGNIGLTSTQQLIKEERDIAEFNIYSYIAGSFKERFCLLVY
jgi:hypothetical protein